MGEELVDLHLILKELRELKALIREDLELDKKDLVLDTTELAAERYIIKQEEVLEEGEKRIEQKATLTAADLSGLHYVSLDVWRRMIWESCDARRSKVLEKEINYECALYGGPCRFEVCPKNMSRKKS